jgi:hypothetical protein
LENDEIRIGTYEEELDSYDKAIIKKRIECPTMKIEHLCEELKISKTLYYRKIKNVKLQERLNSIQNDLIKEVKERLHNLGGKALEKLEDMLDESADNIKIKACEIILKNLTTINIELSGKLGEATKRLIDYMSSEDVDRVAGQIKDEQ